MHIPCREPLAHLMSQINMNKGHETFFDCTLEGDALVEQVRHNVGVSRFRTEWYQHMPNDNNNITMRCFDPMPPQRYVDWMGRQSITTGTGGGGGLQHKRVQNEYVHRSSNSPRDKKHECIWSQPLEYQQRVRDIMAQVAPYYAYCRNCMGTESELPLLGDDENGNGNGDDGSGQL